MYPSERVIEWKYRHLVLIAKKKQEKLAVLWTSGDRVVAEKSCLMYTHAAKRNGWFDEVVLIVWGSSSRLLAEDEDHTDHYQRQLADLSKKWPVFASALRKFEDPDLPIPW